MEKYLIAALTYSFLIPFPFFSFSYIEDTLNDSERDSIIIGKIFIKQKTYDSGTYHYKVLVLDPIDSSNYELKTSFLFYLGSEYSIGDSVEIVYNSKETLNSGKINHWKERIWGNLIAIIGFLGFPLLFAYTTYKSLLAKK